MKKLLILLLCVVSLAVKAQIVNIPDANFLKGLIAAGVDINYDGKIQESEALLVTEINVNGKNISSLEGIASFKNLIKLDCGSNLLTALDLSKNPNLEELACGGNKLASLDLSNNIKLTDLLCDNNDLANLDLSKNPVPPAGYRELPSVRHEIGHGC